MWLHDHNKGKRKIDVNTLEEVKEIESGQLNSYGGDLASKIFKTHYASDVM
jgi:hypothetical protein